MFLSEILATLKHPKNVKSINTTVSHTKASRHEGVRKRGVLKNTCSWKSKM